MKLEFFVVSPGYQAVILKVLNFSSEYGELQNTSQQEISPYSIEILVFTPLFHGANDSILQNLLQKRIDKDTRELLQQVCQIKRKPLIGSWTFFQKETTIEYMKKSKINYKSLLYPFCKIYLHFLVDTIEVLELPYIFEQTYEQVCKPGFYI